MKITVYFNNGASIECADVIDRRRFWRMVSKWCTYHNRYHRDMIDKPMRVERVVFGK